MSDEPTSPISDDVIEQALENCATEPVHIPGIVQPFGCLVCANAATEMIEYASANTADILYAPAEYLLNTPLRDLASRELMHALNNAAGISSFDGKLKPLGTHHINGRDVSVHAFASGNMHVLQFEAVQQMDLGGGEALTTLRYLMQQVQTCPDQASLFKLTTELLRHLSGYDRVMIYKFDQQFNGEVVAETKARGMEPFLGLRFPQWDIPKQARDLMLKFPLRFIQDVDQASIPLLAAHPDLPPLDISLAESRGVSAVHMQYLRNMGSKATMTLTITSNDALWGIISFHHRRTRVPPARLREVLVAFLDLFCTKLDALQNLARLEQLQKIDRIKDDVLKDIDENETMETAMPHIGPVILQVLKAEGVALLSGSESVIHGTVPDQSVLDSLMRAAQEQAGAPVITDNLALKFPDQLDALNGCAGAFASAISPNRALCIFRAEQVQSVNWAGSPDKDIQIFSGQARLEPRGSFATYLQDVKGCSAEWTTQDIYFADRIWTLVNSAERQAMKNTLNRQQALMINELNHRVRNILALVRSVSRQARRHYGSLDSYSTSLESRIQALAAAHDIASGSSVASVGLRQLITVEMSPYQTDGRVKLNGTDHFLRAEIAPIFSLVVHELATNAAKYGALSNEAGTVEIDLEEAHGGMRIQWRESGGPEVAAPNQRGFGSTLIEQAVPHEMGGTAELRFEREGVEAALFLPESILDMEAKLRPPRSESAGGGALVTSPLDPFDPAAFDGFVLLVEDNYTIAKDAMDQLVQSGLTDVELCSNAPDALQVLETDMPIFAILDVNLGPGQTSEAVALRLLDLEVPFIFVTGYGDKAVLNSRLSHVPRLTKPVETSVMLNAMTSLVEN